VKVKAQSTKIEAQCTGNKDQSARPKHKDQVYSMYRRPKFLEVLHAIREEMSREADYDVDLFAEMVRSGVQPTHGPERVIRGFKTRAPREETKNVQPGKRRQRKRAAQ
jgi:hypothetical protein